MKFIKLFYLSLATFHTSTTMIQDQNHVVAYQNRLISTDGNLHHKYTFITNASYSPCFKDPMEITWLYKAQRGYKVISFSSSLKSPPYPTAKRPLSIGKDGDDSSSDEE